MTLLGELRLQQFTGQQQVCIVGGALINLYLQLFQNNFNK